MDVLKETNLSKLYKFLQLGGRYTAKDLSTKFNLPLRTVQANLKILKERYGLKNEKRYYYFLDSYRKIDIDERVQMSVALMLSLYKYALGDATQSILNNFKQIPKAIDAFLFDIDFQPLENEAYFHQITDAIIKEYAIQFKYKNINNIKGIKNVYPLKISNVIGYWYLMGYDLEQEKVKTYYFNNIKDLIINKEENFLSTKKRHQLIQKAKEMFSPWYKEEQKSVKLSIGGNAYFYIKRKSERQFEILKDDGQTFLIKMYYYNDVEVLTFVKKWLPDIKIVENENLKKELKKILKEYVKIL